VDVTTDFFFKEKKSVRSFERLEPGMNGDLASRTWKKIIKYETRLQEL
jgi:hypothetical protein